jgi:hypothetical protein
MSALTLKNLRSFQPGRVELTHANLVIAGQVVQELWNERQKEKFIRLTGTRESSCKFAALLARELFGGTLAGNDEHVFLMHGDIIVDLNKDQPDVKALSALAHIDIPPVLSSQAYLEALGSCVERVSRWVPVAIQRIEEPAKTAKHQHQSDGLSL